MNKKLAIFGLLVASGFMGLPIEASASSAVKETSSTTSGTAQIYVMEQPRQRRWGRAGYWRHGRWYKNYGQYRRTQVGWRGRQRMVPRYYWGDRRRYSTKYRRSYYYR